ncbi:hypothetical protein OBV_10030 [Oscillibacter valericigenes Sjm18-20]|nr:hypothetical protein OBV_10030 [Oscillibacter valericigenes Sjm18-20]
MEWHPVRKYRRPSLQMLAILPTVLIGFLMILWVCLTTVSENVSLDNEPTYQITGPWRVSVDGEKRGTVTLPANPSARAGDCVVYTTVLEKQPTFCNFLMFHSSHQYVRVYLDGELLMSYGRAQKTSVPMSPGSPWQSVRLPSEWVGKELSIELAGYYDNYAGELLSVSIGTKAGLLFSIVKNALPVLIPTFPTLLYGLVMLAVSFCFHEQAGRRMRYLGLFTTTTAVWILLEAHITQLFSGNILLNMNLIFILFSLVPVFAVCYLLTYPEFEKSRYIRFVLAASFVNSILIHALRFLGLVDYLKSVQSVHLMLLLTMCGILGVYIREKRDGHELNSESRILFAALIVLSVFGLMDIVRFYMPITDIAAWYSSIGLFCFVLLLGYSAVRQEARNKAENIEREIYRKLAYTDILTGLKNRTAFEEQMELYRQKSDRNSLIIMMADMNDLKWINDNLGHKAGDQALMVVAHLLAQNFEKCLCYRIGGDEFCVFSERHTEQEFTAAAETFTQVISAQKIAAGHTLSISCGYVRQNGRTVDQTLVRADSKMYEKKMAYRTRNGMG